MNVHLQKGLIARLHDRFLTLLEIRYLPIFAYLLTRVILLFVYKEMFISDVPVYFKAASAGIVEGKMAYRDFFFPYPPLSLILIYLPTFFSQKIEGYYHVFVAEMVIFDIAVFYFIYRLGKTRLKLASFQVNMALVVYCFFSLFVGHLIFNRIDICLVFILLGMAYFQPTDKRNTIINFLFVTGGILIKLLPVFFLPLLVLVRGLSHWQEEWKSNVTNLIKVFCFYFIPALSVLVLYNSFTRGGLFVYLGEHSLRGIQIQSVWALPFWVRHLQDPTWAFTNQFIYGGDHVHQAQVPLMYLWLAKYLGFSILGIFYVFLFLKINSLKAKNPQYQMSFNLFFLTNLAVIIFLLTSQRVLSPQFFIWLLPFICLFIAKEKKWRWFLGVLLLYILTYLEFDVGYSHLPFTKDRIFVQFLYFRNVVLISLCFFYLLNYESRLREEIS